MRSDARDYVALNTLMIDPWKAQEACLARGGPGGVLAAPPSVKERLIPPAARERLAGADAMAAAELREAAELGAAILTPADEDFPPALAELGSVRGSGAPLAVYVLGDLRALSLPAVAIVGSRQATPYGLEVARLLAWELARRGVAIVSGLARGIDSAAHRGALEAGGVTVAILGSGLRRVYPPEHRGLLAAIVRSGLALTELPLHAPPLAPNFPRRNRLIAALADVLLVVEAAEGSGSRHTADAASALGRTVMAVPGPITAPTSRGSNALLRDGALVVTGPEDVLVAIQSSHRWAGRLVPLREAPSPEATLDPASDPDGVGRRLIEKLSVECPRHVEELAVAAGAPLPEVLAALQVMVTEGLVKQLPGQRFQLPGVRPTWGRP